MKVAFNWVTDDNGIEGLLFEGAPSHFDAIQKNESQYFNPMNLIIHDILEHDHKNDNGSVECELMAVGGACYGRGNHGTVTPDGIINDIISLSCDSINLKKTTKGIKKFEPIEWIIESINIQRLKHDIKIELCDDDISNKAINDYIKLAIQYIRIGARRAHKRFKNSFDMYNLFDKMVRELSRVVKYFDEYTEKLIIQFNYQGNFKIYTKQLTNDYY